MFELHTWATECLMFQFDELKLESQGYSGSMVPQRGVQWGPMLGQVEKRVGRIAIAAEVVVGASLIKEDFQWGSIKTGSLCL